MPIPEDQLDTWAKQGPTKQFTDTYASIKRVLEDRAAPYAQRTFDVHLQGSYGNDTNVYGDSDVDVVICCTGSYYYDLDYLTQIEKSAFTGTLTPGVGFSSDTFRGEVTTWLHRNFPGSIVPGTKKAIKLRGNQNRRDADILVCLEHRQYTRFNNHVNEHHYKGIEFYTTTGQKIVNFPKLHAANCTAKHQATNGYFKPTVRMFKNMRNRLLDDGELQDGEAPSYFIEGLLHNVPSNLFGTSYTNTFVGCFNWLHKATKADLVCANGRRYLLRDGPPDCWPPANCEKFLGAVRDLWAHW